MVKVTLIFSFRLGSVCACVLFSPSPNVWRRAFRGCSIFMSASQDSDKVLQNPNRSESKPKCHLSFPFPLWGFSPIWPSRSYLGHCANKEHPVFKMGEALLEFSFKAMGIYMGGFHQIGIGIHKSFHEEVIYSFFLFLAIYIHPLALAACH